MAASSSSCPASRSPDADVQTAVAGRPEPDPPEILGNRKKQRCSPRDSQAADPAVVDVPSFEALADLCREAGILDQFDPPLLDSVAAIESAHKTAEWKREQRKNVRRSVLRAIGHAEERWRHRVRQLRQQEREQPVDSPPPRTEPRPQGAFRPPTNPIGQGSQAEEPSVGSNPQRWVAVVNRVCGRLSHTQAAAPPPRTEPRPQGAFRPPTNPIGQGSQAEEPSVGSNPQRWVAVVNRVCGRLSHTQAAAVGEADGGIVGGQPSASIYQTNAAQMVGTLRAGDGASHAGDGSSLAGCSDEQDFDPLQFLDMLSGMPNDCHSMAVHTCPPSVGKQLPHHPCVLGM